MPACKACGAWFVKVKPHEELCDKCECALCRLSSYVAPVVRCKDCKHLFGTICAVCGLLPRKPEDFCSRGERKESADNG